jgi:uncharacterized membrane protein
MTDLILFFKKSMTMKENNPHSFAEEYSRRSLWGNIGLSVFLVATAYGPTPVRFTFYSIVLVLCLQPLIRRRLMEELQRRDETMEDERDSQIQSNASYWSRISLVIGMVMTAVVLSLPAARAMLLAREMLLSWWLVLMVLVADSIGHTVVIAMHKKDRS